MQYVMIVTLLACSTVMAPFARQCCSFIYLSAGLYYRCGLLSHARRSWHHCIYLMQCSFRCHIGTTTVSTNGNSFSISCITIH